MFDQASAVSLLTLEHFQKYGEQLQHKIGENAVGETGETHAGARQPGVSSVRGELSAARGERDVADERDPTALPALVRLHRQQVLLYAGLCRGEHVGSEGSCEVDMSMSRCRT